MAAEETGRVVHFPWNWNGEFMIEDATGHPETVGTGDIDLRKSIFNGRYCGRRALMKRSRLTPARAAAAALNLALSASLADAQRLRSAHLHLLETMCAQRRGANELWVSLERCDGNLAQVCATLRARLGLDKLEWLPEPISGPMPLMDHFDDSPDTARVMMLTISLQLSSALSFFHKEGVEWSDAGVLGLPSPADAASQWGSAGSISAPMTPPPDSEGCLRLVHNRLKPANVLVKNDVVKLAELALGAVDKDHPLLWQVITVEEGWRRLGYTGGAAEGSLRGGFVLYFPPKDDPSVPPPSTVDPYIWAPPPPLPSLPPEHNDIQNLCRDSSTPDPYFRDSFALGALIHYALTLGHHPCGPPGPKCNEEILAIGRGDKAVSVKMLEKHDEFEAAHLVQWLCNPDPKLRIPVPLVPAHVLFWTSERKFRLLSAISEGINVKTSRPRPEDVQYAEDVIALLDADFITRIQPSRPVGSAPNAAAQPFPAGTAWPELFPAPIPYRGSNPSEPSDVGWSAAAKAHFSLRYSPRTYAKQWKTRFRTFSLVRYVRNLWAHAGAFVKDGLYASVHQLEHEIEQAFPTLFLRLWEVDHQAHNARFAMTLPPLHTAASTTATPVRAFAEGRSVFSGDDDNDNDGDDESSSERRKPSMDTDDESSSDRRKPSTDAEDKPPQDAILEAAKEESGTDQDEVDMTKTPKDFFTDDAPPSPASTSKDAAKDFPVLGAKEDTDGESSANTDMETTLRAYAKQTKKEARARRKKRRKEKRAEADEAMELLKSATQAMVHPHRHPSVPFASDSSSSDSSSSVADGAARAWEEGYGLHSISSAMRRRKIRRARVKAPRTHRKRAPGPEVLGIASALQAAAASKP